MFCHGGSRRLTEKLHIRDQNLFHLRGHKDGTNPHKLKILRFQQFLGTTEVLINVGQAHMESLPLKAHLLAHFADPTHEHDPHMLLEVSLPPEVVHSYLLRIYGVEGFHDFKVAFHCLVVQF